MKAHTEAHEETWTTQREPDGDGGVDPDIYTADGERVATPEDPSRSRLISAAPDMARVLLDICDDRKTGVCVSCGQAPCWERCKLDAALRKAGVRP